MTVVDRRPFSQDGAMDPEIDILVNVDAERLRTLYLERLAQYA